jgi:holin-like protein
MSEAFARILTCLALGEFTAKLTDLPLPGPVLGMGFLYASLFFGRASEPLTALADNTLPHLSILFVPAGVGIIVHLDLLRADLLPILGAVIGGTLVTIGVTAAVIEALILCTARRFAPTEATDDAVQL